MARRGKRIVREASALKAADDASVKGFDARLRLLSMLFFAVSILIVLVVANTPLPQEDEDFKGVNQAALNAIAGVGAAIMATIPVFPWSRLPRDAYFVVPTVGTLLIALCAYYSGGWDSFAYRLYVLPAVFYGLYFSVRLVVLGVGGVLLAGASPLLYDPDSLELAEYLAVLGPLYLTVAFVSYYMVHQVALRERQKERLRWEAETDGLTGISNRRHFERRLSEELERNRRLKEGFALLFMDLDDFKQINDLRGHTRGDEALRLVARTLDENTRRVDVIARYGGEEFAVLMPGIDPEESKAFYERFRQDLLRRSREELGFAVRLSAGAVGSRSAGSAGELLASADEAMYEAKRRGKDRIFVAEP